ncbi:hypothetical protein [Klebsiella michiganensis]|uniref:hypothetical protein n=1 Tax=Klebsiella michiganensis TaxID=1134687 RepID=UPI0012B83110|nr:hypothetical protein [Klebsiella michiganensis]
MKFCKYCSKPLTEDNSITFMIGKYKKYPAHFCAGSDCYRNFVSKNESIADISRRRANEAKHAPKKAAYRPFTRTGNFFS